MKIQIRSILFALVIPVAACGQRSNDAKPTVDFQLSDYVVQPKSDVGSVPLIDEPVVSRPVGVIETVAVPTTFAEHLVAGKDLVSKGKYGDAKLMFEGAIKLDKKNAEPHIELARMYIEMKEKGLAVASANKAIKLAPNSSQAWNTKGRAELNAHKYEEAIEAFTKSVELNETNVFAWNNLGYTELLLKRYADAAEHLKEATSRPGATGYMFNNLGTALEHLDELDDARVAYEAGGKLGSSAAASSRKRLEGVDTIHVASTEDIGTVHDEVRAEAPKTKEYDLTDEGEIAEQDIVIESTDIDEEVDSEVEELEDEPKPGDNATL